MALGAYMIEIVLYVIWISNAVKGGLMARITIGRDILIAVGVAGNALQADMRPS